MEGKGALKKGEFHQLRSGSMVVFGAERDKTDPKVLVSLEIVQICWIDRLIHNRTGSPSASALN